MKAKILKVKQGQDFHKNVEYSMTILGDFMDFDSVTPSTQKVVLSFEQYAKYKDQENKELNLNIIPPVSKYAMGLAD